MLKIYSEEFSTLIPSLSYIVSDVDGTLTTQDKFYPQLVSDLWSLKSMGISVILVTGRPAGWVESLVEYLPVAAGISENGGALHLYEKESLILPDIKENHRLLLEEAFHSLLSRYPSLKVTHDNDARLTDWTFEVKGLDVEDLLKMKAHIQDLGFQFTWSSIHCHIMPLGQSKKSGIQKALPQLGCSNFHQLLTIGDSLNDEPMFDPETFPTSVGVKNIMKNSHLFKNLPKFITNLEGGQGFGELVTCLRKHKNL